MAERFHLMPWDMGRLTVGEFQQLTDLFAEEARERRKAQRRSR